MSTVFWSKGAMGTCPVAKSLRSRPPEGATQRSAPPARSKFSIDPMAAKFCLCFMDLSSGSEEMCFLEWMQSKLRPMEKGMARGSVVTLCPATYVSLDAASPMSSPSVSKRLLTTCGSASDWWLARNTTFSPAATLARASFKLSWPRTMLRSRSMAGRKKSQPNL
eukprot:scaffold51859_cov52-Attheya_sp.AAC.2